MGQQHSVTSSLKVQKGYKDEVMDAVNYALGEAHADDELVSRLEIGVTCRDLPSSVNCYVSIHSRDSRDMDWRNLGVTQTSRGFPEISFAESVLVEFNFESATMLRFEVIDPGTGRLLGVCECFMAALVGPRVGSSILSVQEPTFLNEPSQTRSRLVPSLEVFVDNAGHNVNSITFEVELELLKQASHQSGGSFVLEFRRTNDHQAQLVYRSPPVEGSGTTHVSFPEVNASSERLCKGDIWRSIEIRIYDGVKKTARLVGSSLVTFYDLERCFARRQAGKRLLLKLFGSDKECCGFLAISVSRFEERFSFLDYVTAGLDINVLVGIDMTRSNGDPRAPGSLHSFSANAQHDDDSNEYLKVIREVVSILEPFDSDKRYPVFGFGAKLPPSCSRVSHCFALNGNFLAPEVDGIEGILRAYREALGVVSLHGPTKFAQVLKTSLDWASHRNSNNLKYFVLLLITDGAMEDLQASVDQIVELAHLPVSIIIVGVGDGENFEKMRFLDADTSPLISSVTGETMTRDIVQFVAFRDFKSSKNVDESEKRKSLATACLEELPRQVTEYFGKHKMVFPKRTGKRNFQGFTGPRTATGNGKLFSHDKKTDLVMLIHNQGYDEMAVSRLLHDPGFMSADPFHVIDVMFHLKRFPRTGREQTLAEKLHVTDLILEDAVKETTNDEALQDLDGYRATSYGSCRVCYTRAINVAIKPCGHKIVCKSCLSKLGKLCPLCRDTISGYNAI